MSSDVAEFQKLNNECSKLKTQLLVLKGSYQEEQAKNNSLGDLIKQQETQIKRLNAELDSLRFQNRQLTKKVTVLQEDLQKTTSKAASSSKDSKDSSHSSSVLSIEEFSVLDFELQNKIRENAQLHLDFEEQKSTSERQVQQLDTKLQQLRLDCDSRLKNLQHALESEQQRCAQLVQEKSRLETKLIEYLAEMQQSKAQSSSRIVIEPLLQQSDSVNADDVAAAAHAKLLQLLEKYELAESKSLSFEVECKLLENRLEIAEDALQSARQNNEALSTSVKNYEAQLSAMSEYVATLDEKIIRQNDELEELRTALKQKTK